MSFERLLELAVDRRDRPLERQRTGGERGPRVLRVTVRTPQPEATDVTVAPVRSSPIPAVTTETAAGSERMARFRASASMPDTGIRGLSIMRRESSGDRACLAAAMTIGSADVDTPYRRP